MSTRDMAVDFLKTVRSHSHADRSDTDVELNGCLTLSPSLCNSPHTLPSCSMCLRRGRESPVESLEKKLL